MDAKPRRELGLLPSPLWGGFGGGGRAVVHFGAGFPRPYPPPHPSPTRGEGARTAWCDALPVMEQAAMSERIEKLFIGGVTLLLFLSLWQASVSFNLIDPLFVSSP